MVTRLFGYSIIRLLDYSFTYFFKRKSKHIKNLYAHSVNRLFGYSIIRLMDYSVNRFLVYLFRYKPANWYLNRSKLYAIN